MVTQMAPSSALYSVSSISCLCLFVVSLSGALDTLLQLVAGSVAHGGLRLTYTHILLLEVIAAT